MGRVWGECGGLGIHWSFSVPPPYHDDGDKVTTRDAHGGHHNEHLKTLILIILQAHMINL